MWKYIIIGSVALFLAASYLFNENNKAMASGEVTAVQNQYAEAVRKNKEIYLDKTIKEYAAMRTEWFSAEKQREEGLKQDIETETSEVEQEISELTAKYQAIEGDLKRLREELRNVLIGAATAVGLDPDEADQEQVAEKVRELMESNEALEKKIAEEEATIAALGKESERLNTLITAARKLNQDRQARISPAELACTVLTADPNWDYVILDAGVNKGIVIGSRLAVERNGKKICELNVTTVEATRTSCEVVYSTLLPGESVKIGDRVKAVRNNK